MLQALSGGGCRVGDLASRLRLAQSTSISTLIGAGLVTRSVDAADRRAATVSLTDAGAENVEHWHAAHRRRLDDALAALDVPDRRVVYAALPVLRRLVEALERAA